MKILGIIPARFGSTRFPEKLLKSIDEVSVLEMTYNQCLKSKLLSKVVVATDHESIFSMVTEFGGEVVMTSESHQSGTDRCAEALNICGGASNFEYVVNIQGDEPLISPKTIDDICFSLNLNTQIASSCIKINNLEDLLSANIVKVVIDEKKHALYFSRSPIPYIRGLEVESWLKENDFYKHLGLYAFKANVLQDLVKLPMSRLETQEKLEQLRWLSNGYKINMIETGYESIGIDTEEDFNRLKQFLGKK